MSWLREELDELEKKMKEWPEWKLQEFEAEVQERAQAHREAAANSDDSALKHSP